VKGTISQHVNSLFICGHFDAKILFSGPLFLDSSTSSDSNKKNKSLLQFLYLLLLISGILLSIKLSDLFRFYQDIHYILPNSRYASWTTYKMKNVSVSARSLLGLSGSLNSSSIILCPRRKSFLLSDTLDVQLICTEHSYTQHSERCFVISTSFMHYCRYSTNSSTLLNPKSPTDGWF